MSFTLGISLGLGSDSVGPPAGSGGGGGDAPPITDNLQVYYNPEVEAYSDAGTTLAVDGDNVRQFNDQSGNGNTLNQTTASSQPLYDTTTLGNGNASIYALNDFMSLTNNLSVGASDSYTMYMVYKKSANSTIYYSIRGENSLNRFEHRTTLLNFKSATGGAHFWTYTDNTDLKVIATTLDRDVTTNGEHKLYVNGAYVGIRDYTINWTNEISRIFANGNAYMYYGSFLWYDAAHSATDVATISDWLNTKYSFPNY